MVSRFCNQDSVLHTVCRIFGALLINQARGDGPRDGRVFSGLAGLDAVCVSAGESAAGRNESGFQSSRHAPGVG